VKIGEPALLRLQRARCFFRLEQILIHPARLRDQLKSRRYPGLAAQEFHRSGSLWTHGVDRVLRVEIDNARYFDLLADRTHERIEVEDAKAERHRGNGAKREAIFRQRLHLNKALAKESPVGRKRSKLSGRFARQAAHDVDHRHLPR